MKSHIQTGHTIPEGEFLYIPWTSEHEDSTTRRSPTTLNTQSWAGKRVLVVSVPSAFATDSNVQIPSYINHVAKFKGYGIDLIVILSANDALVQSGWQSFHGVKDEVIFVSDPNAKWSSELGLSDTHHHQGARTERYVLVLDNLVVKNAFIESAQTIGIDVTSADYVLHTLEMGSWSRHHESYPGTYDV